MKMKLPELEKPTKYVGLYIVDFGDYTSVGFTAQEVAEILESEKYKNVKVYKIHKAYPDGKLELKGISAETFHLEMGMFFYSDNLESTRQNFKALLDLAISSAPPCRAKIHLAKYSDNKFTVVLIYPAEFNSELSAWLLTGNYKTPGTVEGGLEAVNRYYNDKPEILSKHQLFSQSEQTHRTGRQLLANLKSAVQR